MPHLLVGLLVSAATLCFAAQSASATVYSFDLTTSFTDQNGSGQALSPSGGTHDGTGFHFNAVANNNEGLTLSNVIGAGNAYSIEMKFSIDATSSWRRLIDFKDRQSDTGLYNLDTAVQLYPEPTSAAGVFTANQVYDLILQRSATSQVTVSVDGSTVYSDDDSVNGYADFTATTIAFFLDNVAGVAPNEVAGGTVTSIVIDTDAVSRTPIPAALPLFASGLGMLGFVARRRKRKTLSA
ncbi:MAG: VPLPA-CTERM sorting domain-containing protein [Xanthobacteraceae bacterium]